MTARLIRLVAVVTLVGSFGVWVYAFSGRADRDPPDLLNDASWSTAAEEICADALSDVDDIPSAQQAGDAGERSQQVLAATGRFETMVDQLADLPAATPRDEQITTDWLADFRVLMGDRRRYADAVADDPAAVFTITDTGVGERLDRRITRFAVTNSMPSCVTPTDV